MKGWFWKKRESYSPPLRRGFIFKEMIYLLLVVNNCEISLQVVQGEAFALESK
jgi:hypothetical protein